MYFRDTSNVCDELDELISSRQTETQDDRTADQKPVYKDKISLKVMFYMLLMMLSNQLCGVNVVITFTDSIPKITGVFSKPELVGFSVDLVMFLFIVISTQIIGRINRRSLLFKSLSFSSIAMVGLGFFFHVRPGPSYGWFPIVCLAALFLSFSQGMGPLGFVLLGDFSLPHLAALAGTISRLTKWDSAFLMTIIIFSDMSVRSG